MKPQLGFILDYRVRFTIGRFSYDGAFQRAKVTEWSHTSIVGSESVKFRVSPLPSVIIRLFSEILRQATYPKACEFKSAYILLHNEQQYFAFDRLTLADKPAIPAIYGSTNTASEELGAIVRAYNKKFEATDGFQKISIPDWVARAGLVEHKVSFTYDSVQRGGRGTEVKIHVRDDVKFYRFPLGEYCGALPLPGFFTEALDTKKAILISRYEGADDRLVPSTQVWDALGILNGIVRNEKQQIVLLRGDPGAGKQIFADAIHYGSVRKAPENYTQIGVAGLSLSALRRTLFGSTVSKGGVVDGVIAQSEGGTLLLDEFDKASIDSQRYDFASALLRVLESSTYYPEDSLAEREIGNVSWILAGAFAYLGKKSGPALIQLPGMGEGNTQSVGNEEGTVGSTATQMPKDLWSRFTDYLYLENPMKERGYAKAMFIYWHFVETVRWLGNDKEVLSRLSSDDSLPGVIARLMLLGEELSSEENAETAIRPGRIILAMASAFEGRLGRVGREKFGARSIRQAATAASRELRACVIARLNESSLTRRLRPTDMYDALERASHVLGLMGIEE